MISQNAKMVPCLNTAVTGELSAPERARLIALHEAGGTSMTAFEVNEKLGPLNLPYDAWASLKALESRGLVISEPYKGEPQYKRYHRDRFSLAPGVMISGELSFSEEARLTALNEAAGASMTAFEVNEKLGPLNFPYDAWASLKKLEARGLVIREPYKGDPRYERYHRDRFSVAPGAVKNSGKD